MANDFFSWLAVEEAFAPASLTVRAQALPPDDRDNLVHQAFFPRRDVDSTKLSNFITTDFRPAADRREWNTRGRLIPVQTFKQQELSMIPIESYFKIAEQEIQALLERTLGVEALIRQLIGVSIPERTDGLVQSNLRRMEFDALQAWAQGTITAMNPQQGVTTTVSYGIDTARYQTAGTAWNNGAVNAYDEFIAWVEDGRDAIGGNPAGAVMRRATYNEIQKDAPQGILALPLTRQEFEGRVRADLGFDFRFFVIENRLDKAVDGGLTFTRTNVWPAQKVALVPQGIAVGEMAFAPVARAFELARLHPDAEIDVRGMNVFREIAGNGRELTIECQVNAFPVPNENNIWVIDAGV